jgi:hypothetical protein
MKNPEESFALLFAVFGGFLLSILFGIGGMTGY